MTDAKWREDFPYTSEGEDDVTRREFVRYLVLASGAFAAGGVGVAAWASLRRVNEGEPRRIVSLAEVPVGTAYLFRYPTEDDPAILLHLRPGDVVAFSQKCTHLGCVVYWDERHDELVCPCHEGIFDPQDGAVLAGPPQRPLERIDVEVRSDGEVWALHGGAT
ncbi:MAG: ubiquinol-cytochrome c reductase iron-sulfur subunit [Acidimicrobiia bacterium]|nr:ubiquinol-cytochrome c reductase iron-sulfur subunit [Acidimicrobiia bacterium]